MLKSLTPNDASVQPPTSYVSKEITTLNCKVLLPSAGLDTFSVCLDPRDFKTSLHKIQQMSIKTTLIDHRRESFLFKVLRCLHATFPKIKQESQVELVVALSLLRRNPELTPAE
jgi:hypothetical protein